VLSHCILGDSIDTDNIDNGCVYFVDLTSICAIGLVAACTDIVFGEGNELKCFCPCLEDFKAEFKDFR